MLKFLSLDDDTRCSTFSVAEGCDEAFITISSSEGSSFSEALAELDGKYASALDSLGLCDGTAAFGRVFLSDILNQKAQLSRSALGRRLRDSCALSVIEQKPLRGGPVSLLSYHLRDSRKTVTKQRLPPVDDSWRNDWLLKGRHYSLLLTANQTGGQTFDAYAQTQTILDSFNVRLADSGMSLLANGVRTWLYVRDLDNHYKDMVRARREFFAAHGLTDKTRYLASTGIQGMTGSPEQIVSMDSLSVGGLATGQIVRMQALSHLWPTILYGVTFERGLRVQFGDRSHLYISGTASIDTKGDVLHEGHAELQCGRAIENVRALLAEQSATLADLAYVIVYVRNAHDRQQVERVLDQELGRDIPLVFTEAAVCRPAWLVEVEGVAIIPDSSAFPPFL